MPSKNNLKNKIKKPYATQAFFNSNDIEQDDNNNKDIDVDNENKTYVNNNNVVIVNNDNYFRNLASGKKGTEEKDEKSSPHSIWMLTWLLK
ncbi:hypothetical protein [Bacillus cihuensis]|uniref:hypothetical protein n=1 Tax=Bacillus cihuensis TaxID=1208599 RepID=UPI00048A8D71|nr:hypothetical protein [Bacillus cihuensis]